MSARPPKLRAEVPPWAVGEASGAALDLAEIGPVGVECLCAFAAELRKVDPSREAIRAVIREARAGTHRFIRHHFDRLENRLDMLFGEQKRDWKRARP